MKIESPSFKDSEQIPSRHTCDGEGSNPPLILSNIPGGARSLALIVDDPDAPAGTWIHWTMWNILPDTGAISENSVPAGAIQGVNSFGKPSWGGPCPPSGVHRYFFKLYALDIDVKLPPETTAAELEEAMAGHILARAELIGWYSRQ